MCTIVRDSVSLLIRRLKSLTLTEKIQPAAWELDEESTSEEKEIPAESSDSMPEPGKDWSPAIYLSLPKLIIRATYRR